MPEVNFSLAGKAATGAYATGPTFVVDGGELVYAPLDNQ